MLAITHRGWLGSPCLSATAFLMMLLPFHPAQAQGLFWDSLGVLPGTLTRIEYQNMEALRKMPHFASLRKSYVDSSLADLEKWLGVFGLSEGDVAEVLLGREVRNSGGHVFAIASGRFEIAPPEAGIPQSRFATVQIGDLKGFCEGPSSEWQVCAVFRGMNWAAVGRREFLTHVVEVGSDLTEPLSADTNFMDLATTIPRDAPLWGIVLGPEAIYWFKANIPFSDSVPIVWTTLFEDLEGLTYSVIPSDARVHVTVTLEYENSTGASALGEVLQGVKALEGIFWKAKYPGVPDPFHDADVTVDDRTVKLASALRTKPWRAAWYWARPIDGELVWRIQGNGPITPIWSPPTRRDFWHSRHSQSH